MAEQMYSGNSPSSAALVSYVATISADLANMARRSGLDTLGYLLEMVCLEAENVTKHRHNAGRLKEP